MILTQTEWDERSKITTIPNLIPYLIIITSDSTLDNKKILTQLGGMLDTGSYGVALRKW